MGGFVFRTIAMATAARSKHPVVLVRAGETENLLAAEAKSPRSATPCRRCGGSRQR
ncbi:hypothetical protein ACFZBC_16240 [Streptomyces luteogriseus]|uniref:hypothetical protein n=1 Tax=Streptomyces luteogriseus TaxID=68233 RepID=UPI0036EC4404